MTTVSTTRASSPAIACAAEPRRTARSCEPRLSARRRPAPASPWAALSKPPCAKRQMTTSFISYAGTRRVRRSTRLPEKNTTIHKTSRSNDEDDTKFELFRVILWIVPLAFAEARHFSAGNKLTGSLQRARQLDDAPGERFNSLVERVTCNELTARLFLGNRKFGHLVVSVTGACFVRRDVEIIEFPLSQWLPVRHHHVAHFGDAWHVVFVIGDADNDRQLSFEQLPAGIGLPLESQFAVAWFDSINERDTWQA